MSILDKLNDMQKKAAILVEGPGLILAGAGSGKTRTITHKIAYMIKEANIPSYNILALTFTNKAANEMKERIESLVGESSKSMQISTFHSFGVLLLRKYSSFVNLSSSFNIYDTQDSASIINRIIKSLFLKNPLTASNYVSKISKLKEAEIMPKDYTNMVNMSVVANREFYDVYTRYQEELKRCNSIDFSDILYYTKKLTENSQVLPILQEKYKYILVDEYQDTNELQYKIIRNLAKKYKNIWVVGDEDQSIYAFRGANIKNILNFENDYSDANVVRLEQNYRSTTNILNLANSVIKKNTMSLGKNLWTKNADGKKPIIYEAENHLMVAKYIVSRIKNSNKNLSNFAILYRNNYQSRIVEQELMANGIAYIVYGGLAFYARKEIKDLLAYLSIICNPRDRINFERAITNPRRKIGEKTLEEIFKYANDNNLDYINSLSYFNSPKIAKFKSTMDYLIEFSKTNKVSDLLKEIIEKTEYLDYISKEENFEDKNANISELCNSILLLENTNENLSLTEYIETISLASTLDASKENAVKLMTIHSSKGLEFDTVFLIGFEQGVFPNERSCINVEELEEERRLLYVAITRAMVELHICHSKNRVVYGSYQTKPISDFYYDMDRKYLEILNNNTGEYKKNISNIENFNPFKIKKENTNDKYYIGKIVNHIAYGKGKIKSMDDKAITVEFTVGEKRIVRKLADNFLK